MKFYRQDNALVVQRGNERLFIESWGKNSLRVRMTKDPCMDRNDWALSEPCEKPETKINIQTVDITEPWYHGPERDSHAAKAEEATVTNGNISAKISFEGWISFFNQKGELLTKEYWRTRDRIDRYAVPLRVPGRELKPITGTTDYSLDARFEAFDGEHIYGMGVYQDACFDRACAQKQPELRTLFCFQPWLWIFVEQSSNRLRKFRDEQNGMAFGQHKKNGLLDYGGRQSLSDYGAVHIGCGAHTHDA